MVGVAWQSTAGDQYDPADAVMRELVKQSRQQPGREDSFEDKLAEIRHLRDAAWEWTDVDGQRMRGCDLLQEHAIKLTEEVTGAADLDRGPPDAVVLQALRARQRREDGSMTHVDHWVRNKVEALERKVDVALRHAARTNDILEALAKQQGVNIPALAVSPHVDTVMSSSVDGDASAAGDELLQPPGKLQKAPLPARGKDLRPSPIRRKMAENP